MVNRNLVHSSAIKPVLSTYKQCRWRPPRQTCLPSCHATAGRASQGISNEPARLKAIHPDCTFFLFFSQSAKVMRCAYITRTATCACDYGKVVYTNTSFSKANKFDGRTSLSNIKTSSQIPFFFFFFLAASSRIYCV